MDLLTSILGIPRFLGVRWPSRQLPVLKKTDSFLEIVQNSFWCKGCKYSMSFTSCTITSAHLVIEQTSAFFVFFFFFLFLLRGGWGGVQLVRTVICFVFWFFPCSKGFSLDSLIYLPSQKPTLQFLIRSRCTDIS